ncbi:hypothetical protein OC187_01340 [Anaplasma capra]|nr:hypothetical protein [Anaplasma capra]
MVVAFLMQNKGKFFRDNIQIFFSESEKKGIVTFEEASVTKISIIAGNRYNAGIPYVMIAELSKSTICVQGEKKYAERNIGLQGYSHSWEHETNSSDVPQMTVLISGSNKKSAIEADFSHFQGRNSLVIDIKSKRYKEHMPLCRIRSTHDYINGALNICLRKKSFLQVLLEKYLSEENFFANKAKVMYLMYNYGSTLQKSVSVAMNKTLKRLLQFELSQSYSESIVKPIMPEESLSGAFGYLEEEQFKSLESDILTLVKIRACEYENLHESLSHQIYRDIISPSVEEIIACYPDRSNQETNTFFKKHISSTKTLIPKMRAIHKYIEACKKYNGKQLQCASIRNGADAMDTYAYHALYNFAGREGIKTDDLDAVIRRARDRICRKYGELFVDDIVGIAKKVTAHTGKVRVKIKRLKSQDTEDDKIYDDDAEDYALCNSSDVNTLQDELISVPLSESSTRGIC